MIFPPLKDIPDFGPNAAKDFKSFVAQVATLRRACRLFLIQAAPRRASQPLAGAGAVLETLRGSGGGRLPGLARACVERMGLPWSVS